MNIGQIENKIINQKVGNGSAVILTSAKEYTNNLIIKKCILMYTDESNMYKNKYEASIIRSYTNKFNNEDFLGLQ